jgi:hypothetical protein
MFENRFYKVSHTGGTYVTGMFFNPITGDNLVEFYFENGEVVTIDLDNL